MNIENSKLIKFGLPEICPILEVLNPGDFQNKSSMNKAHS